VLHSFQYSDGSDHYALILSGSTLYGAAYAGIQGISLGDGSIFRISLPPRLYIALAGTNAVLT
jgi:hypothetical protein